MKTMLLTSVLVAGVGTAMLVQADNRVDHFKGLPSETFSEAVRHFSSHNEKLAELLARDELDIEVLVAIHEVTYTLENALEKINDELSELAETLEALHVASETADFEGARKHGQAYLDTARILIP